MRQLISIASADVFNTISNLPLRDYTLRASALEIYNERVRDLAKDGTEHQDLDLLDVRAKQTTLVRDLTVETITSQMQLERLVAAASARRTVHWHNFCSRTKAATSSAVVVRRSSLPQTKQTVQHLYRDKLVTRYPESWKSNYALHESSVSYLPFGVEQWYHDTVLTVTVPMSRPPGCTWLLARLHYSLLSPTLFRLPARHSPMFA